jgi:hypothetical protein
MSRATRRSHIFTDLAELEAALPRRMHPDARDVVVMAMRCGWTVRRIPNGSFELLAPGTPSPKHFAVPDNTSINAKVAESWRSQIATHTDRDVFARAVQEVEPNRSAVAVLASVQPEPEKVPTPLDVAPKPPKPAEHVVAPPPRDEDETEEKPHVV